METVIVLLGLLLPVLAASGFYLGDHRKTQKARVPVRHDQSDHS
ncbi:hypothetical protein [Allosaccharopolyspora coralli]|nr:hypothetical protein [Allosaccharopolyspora coralli]